MLFLTTIRVRRAKPATLDAKITNTDRLRHLKASRDVVEVNAHGQPVAIAALTDASTVGTFEWTDPAIAEHVTEAVLTCLVEANVTLMAAAEKAGLTSRPEPIDASPKAPAGRGRRAAAR